MTTLFLIDDHTIFLEGISQLLYKEPWIDNIHTFTDPDAFLSNREKFDGELPRALFMLDINLNRLVNGIDICKELKKLYPECKVLALSMHEEYRYIKGMINAGADGYLFKTDSIEVILAGIRTVNNGSQYFSPNAEQTLKRAEVNKELLLELNPKEKRILELAFAGKTNKEIGEVLEVSHKTVEYYKSGIFIKFDVKNIIALEKLLQQTND